MPAPDPKLSVVIPVYNEEQVLPTLFARLYPALDALRIDYECVFVNDGSRDKSVALLRQQFQRRPANTRVVMFHANFGQHSAVMAGLFYARGAFVITLDADLQNPPEEIGKLVEMLDQGYDYVGTIRQQRQDFLWRRLLSKGMNKIRERITPVRITDQGCMMRGYSRSVVTALNQTREINTFIPALASLYAMNPIEVPIAHEERYAGQSKYSLYGLIRLNFDLITGFSVMPLQLFSMVGMAVSIMSALLVVYLFVRRIIVGPEAEGVFTLFGLVFFFIGLALFGIGLLGEYVGRIYAQVRERPRYLVEAVLESDGELPIAPGPAAQARGEKLPHVATAAAQANAETHPPPPAAAQSRGETLPTAPASAPVNAQIYPPAPALVKAPDEQPSPAAAKANTEPHPPPPAVAQSHAENYAPPPAGAQSHAENYAPPPAVAQSYAENYAPAPAVAQSHAENSAPPPDLTQSHAENYAPAPAAAPAHADPVAPR